MSLKGQVLTDIKTCEEIINAKDSERADRQIDILISVYSPYISQITNGLARYLSISEDPSTIIEDMEIIKRKLEIFYSHDCLPYAVQRAKSGSININNNNTNQNTNSNSIINEIDVINTIDLLKNEFRSNESLTSEQTDEIIKKLEEIEEIHKSKDQPNEKWTKLRGTLAWLGNKSIDIGIKFIPIIYSIITKKT